MNHRISSSAFADTKPHYELLDGLRGVAALLVVFYHIFEGFSFAGGGTLITVINHGYLAVDFFFILSGFVIGYAYDDRWKKNMTLKGFFKRRLIRLHPMIIMDELYYNKKSEEYVETLEEVEAYRINISDLKNLMETNLELCNWGRIIHQNEYRRLHRSHKERLSLPAKERYEEFQKQFPEIYKKVNLKYISSYL